MAVSRGFLDHALDLLSLAGPVRARAMFGGYGLYLRDAMFGLLDDDEIFLKTDDACRQEFVDAGCEQWVYPSPKGPMATQYFRPPDDAHEDAEAMLPWAGLAIAAARRAARDKAEKAKAREGRKRTRARKKVARKGRRK
jgi:DNA transformation protein